MLFTRFALAALPLIGFAFAAPLAVKRDQTNGLINILNNFKTSISAPITVLQQGAGSSAFDTTDVTNALTQISQAVNSTVTQVQAVGQSAKRQSGGDAEEIGQLVAPIIQEIVEAVEGLAEELTALPVVGALIADIDGGLNTLLLGLEVVVAGVLQVVGGLLAGIAALLGGLPILGGLLGESSS